MKKSALLSLSMMSQLTSFNTMSLEPSEELQKFFNNGLTDKEVEDGYSIDPVLGRVNMRKTLSERQKAMEKEYEAFNTMHNIDGTSRKSSYKL